eukprot:m.211575 g.211575  ORF g.211575 m.211575 type:complete len:771 (-) comp15840_c0_seq1:77-2389(-)
MSITITTTTTTAEPTTTFTETTSTVTVMEEATITSLTLRYDGVNCDNSDVFCFTGAHSVSGDPNASSPVLVRLLDSNDMVVGLIYPVAVGENFTIDVSDIDVVSIEILTLPSSTFALSFLGTSCKGDLTGLNLEESFGPFQVTGYVDNDGATETDCKRECGLLTTSTPAATTTSCSCDVCASPPTESTVVEGKVKAASLTFMYTGDNCEGASCNSQSSDKAATIGDVQGEEPVTLTLTDAKPNKNDGTTLATFENVMIGDNITINGADLDGDKIPTNVAIIITNSSHTISTVYLHASCSQSLSLGDKFGALELIDFENTIGASADSCVPVCHDNDDDKDESCNCNQICYRGAAKKSKKKSSKKSSKSSSKKSSKSSSSQKSKKSGDDDDDKDYSGSGSGSESGETNPVNTISILYTGTLCSGDECSDPGFEFTVIADSDLPDTVEILVLDGETFEQVGDPIIVSVGETFEIPILETFILVIVPPSDATTMRATTTTTTTTTTSTDVPTTIGEGVLPRIGTLRMQFCNLLFSEIDELRQEFGESVVDAVLSFFLDNLRMGNVITRPSAGNECITSGARARRDDDEPRTIVEIEVNLADSDTDVAGAAQNLESVKASLSTESLSIELVVGGEVVVTATMTGVGLTLDQSIADKLSSTTTVNNQVNSANSDENTLSGGAIAGIVIACVLIVIIGVVVIVLYVKSATHKKDAAHKRLSVPSSAASYDNPQYRESVARMGVNNDLYEGGDIKITAPKEVITSESYLDVGKPYDGC